DRSQLAPPRSPGRDHRVVLPPQDSGRDGRVARHSKRHRAVSLLLRVAGAAHDAGKARDHPAMTCAMMLSLSLYVLGAADTAAPPRLECHLPTCLACRAELTRLAPLPGLLAGIPESMRDTAWSPGRRARRSARAPRPARALPHDGARLR